MTQTPSKDELELERVRKAFFKAKRAFADITRRRWDLMVSQAKRRDDGATDAIRRKLGDL